MNTIWSTYLQTPETLYKTRQLRFDDRFKEQYTPIFGIDHAQSILELGAGPGALTQALVRWYPHAEVTGSDRDTDFVAFAKAQAPHIPFVEADIMALPFADNSFDVTISHTVHEHLPPAQFFGEQYRVLRPGGVCLVMSAGRRSINHAANATMDMSDFEKAMQEKTAPYYDAVDEQYGVAKYAGSEQAIPLEMSKYGFKDIQTHYLGINFTPDSSQYDSAFAIKIIEANRQVQLNSLTYLPHIAPDVVSVAEMTQWTAEINHKYDKRVAQYHAGEKQWDVNFSLTMVLRGVR